jgi:hypothetical protein
MLSACGPPSPQGCRHPKILQKAWQMPCQTTSSSARSGQVPEKKGQPETPSFGTAGREHVERHEKRDTSSIIVVSWIIELFGSRIHPE